jgi:hypothetical protein
LSAILPQGNAHQEKSAQLRLPLPNSAAPCEILYAGRPEFEVVHSPARFGFELAMGFGHGNYIIEENVDAVFSLFAEVVQYSLDLPERIRGATK